MRAELLCIQSLMFGAQNDTGYYKAQNGILLPTAALFGKYNDLNAGRGQQQLCCHRVTEDEQKCLLPMPD
jgi:hypothetical protein